MEFGADSESKHFHLSFMIDNWNESGCIIEKRQPGLSFHYLKQSSSAIKPFILSVSLIFYI